MTASQDHEELRRDLASYTVGALASPERSRLEDHLRSCGSCRDELADLAVIPGLLGRLDEEDVTDVPIALSEGHETRVIAAANRSIRRRLRTWQGAAAAAAVAAALSLAMWAPWTGPAGMRHVGTPTTTAAASADVVAHVEEKDWGMYVTLHASGLPDARGYTLLAVAEDGHEAQVASWAHTGEDITVEGSCYMQPEEATALHVVTRDEVVVRIPLDAEGASAG